MESAVLFVTSDHQQVNIVSNGFSSFRYLVINQKTGQIGTNDQTDERLRAHQSYYNSS